MTNKNLLSVGEKDTLTECEKIIERGKNTFVEVGLALTKIRDCKLYRTQFDSFEKYCQARWGWTRQRAHQLIESSEIIKESNNKCQPWLTLSERAVRSLKDVPKDKRAAVVEQAAAAGPVTAKSITAAAKPIVDAVEVHYDDATDHETEIPAAILPEYRRAHETASELLRHITEVKSAVKAGIDNEDRIYAELRNTLIAELDGVYGGLKRLKPYAVCTTCQGRNITKCVFCKGRGFISQFSWQQHVPSEIKTMRKKIASKRKK